MSSLGGGRLRQCQWQAGKRVSPMEERNGPTVEKCHLHRQARANAHTVLTSYLHNFKSLFYTDISSEPRNEKTNLSLSLF